VAEAFLSLLGADIFVSKDHQKLDARSTEGAIEYYLAQRKPVLSVLFLVSRWVVLV
jgi:hypothetical protein